MDSNTKDVLLLAISASGVAFGAWIALQQARIQRQVADVKKEMNGHLTKLVETTAKASKGEGKEEERTEQRARDEKLP